jgi:hypothetical protein
MTLRILLFFTIIFKIILTAEGKMDKYNTSYLLGSYPVIDDLIQNDQNLEIKTTYPRHIPGSTNYNLVVILAEDNKLDSLNINELAHYLASHGIVTSSIKFKSKTNKLSLKKIGF